MNEKTKAMIDAAMVEADKAAQKWVVERQANIGETVERMLDSRLQEIVAKLLGFDGSFGELHVDHCNGRQGESAAGDWLRVKAGDAVRDWLTKQAGELPTLTEREAKDLRESYRETLEFTLRQSLQEKANKDAAQVLNEHLKSVI